MSSTAQASTAALHEARPTARVRGDEEMIVFSPLPDEAEGYDALLRRIDVALDERGVGHLTSPDGSTVDVPASLMAALRRAAAAVTKRRAVTLAPADLEMTSQQAADLLRVSRPHLTKLLDQGEIPHHRTSDHRASHRRVLLQDVLEYRDRRNAVRRRALEELTAIAEESGGDYY